MYRLENGPTILDRNGTGRFAAVALAIRMLVVVFFGLTYLATSALPAGADIEHSNRASFHFGAGGYFHFPDPDLAALRDYAQQIAAQDSGPTGGPPLQVAEADSAFEALREFLRKRSQPPESAPPETTNPPAGPPPGRPRAAPSPPAPSPPKAAAPPLHGRPMIDAHFLGANTCLSCHAPEAASYAKTLMGRINRTTHKGKLDCESCHGPGSAHVRAVGCAACHGEGGISSKPGMPSLVGQDPQYLLPAMRAYVTGQRKHDLMRLVLTGVNEAELHNIALYYARQPAARAQTPPVGDASAGRSATASCSPCHGAQGVSVYPGWPSLAGQDAQYLADAIRGYKQGSRNKAIACAGWQGEDGISTRPGMPSLAGMDPQYLVPAMKAYAAGQRKHELMRVLVSGVSEAELNNMALFYAGQTPARAQTSLVGDPSAGKAAAALCVGCHGEQGGSVAPAWPGLAGQDSQYLAEATRAYKRGSRSKVVACAGCHGEGGISKLPGMPSLAGLSPQYLVGAMEDYVGGERKHELMKALLTGVTAAELNDIAQYYAAQPSARAPTPAVGNPSAGQAASAACAGCHGAQGISANPEWPSLAGQDARYLADALNAYKNGSRDDPVMKRLVAALDERTVNDIASYYATLTPAPPSA